MKIQLLTFTGCPNAEQARVALHEAILEEQVIDPIEEVEIARDDAPSWTKRWGSPTILVDGDDAVGEVVANGESACRLYRDGAPSVAQIRRALRAAKLRPIVTKRGSRLPVIGALITALAASACCLVPVVSL